MAALPMLFRYHGNYAVFSKEKKVVNEDECVVGVWRLVSAPSPSPPFYFQIFFTYAFRLKRCASLTHYTLYTSVTFLEFASGRVDREGAGLKSTPLTGL